MFGGYVEAGELRGVMKSFRVEEVSNGFIVTGNTTVTSEPDTSAEAANKAHAALDEANLSLLSAPRRSYTVPIVVLCRDAEELHTVISRYLKTGMLIASASK